MNGALEAGATVTDIVLLEPITTYDRVFIHDWPEQLVEGHTVFVTIDIPLIPNITNWSADIIGDISCDTHTDVEGYYFMGLPIIPSRINEAHAECQAGGVVFVTPDPFYNSSNTYGGSMSVTGLEYPFTAPNGQSGYATEYSYPVVHTDPITFEQTQTTWYAWAVPVLDPWTHTDGGTKQWFCPIPVSRIDEMGVDHFTGWVTDSPPDLRMM